MIKKLIFILFAFSTVAFAQADPGSMASKESRVATITAYSTTPAFDAGLRSSWSITLTGNVTSSTIVNHAAGQTLRFFVCQDNVGGRTFVWPTSFVNPPTIHAAPNGCQLYIFISDGVNITNFGMLGSTTAGAQGPAGADGKSAYQVAVDGGFVGTVGQWLASLVGAQGVQGPQGVAGNAGAQGPKGDKGDTGLQGVAGPAGADSTVPGPQGLQGIQGPTGNAGAAGPQGIQGLTGNVGPQGPAGNTGANGADGKTVRSGSGAPAGGLGVDGDFYINTAANTIYGPKTSGAWGSPTSIVGPQGSQGIQGNQGIQGIQGLTGNDGAAGAQGIQGIQGIQGPAGPSGLAFREFTIGAAGAAVCTWTNLGASYTECPSQGSRTNIDLSGFTDFRILMNFSVTATTGDVQIHCGDTTAFSPQTLLVQSDNPGANALILGSWTTIPAGCKTAGGVYVRVGMINGNTTEDPAFRVLKIQVR